MSAALQKAHHLKVRIDGSEFESNGDVDVVNAQYALYLQAIGGRKPTNGHTGNGTSSRTEQPIVPEQEELAGMWARFYASEGDNCVSVRSFPNTDQVNADVIVLLLYGFEQLCQKDRVGGAELLAMAKKSGLRIDRIDRSLPDSYARYINRGGARRGLRYSLNNQGKAYAQQLLEAEAER